jgi:phosphoribosylaminoimidazolecarboxamide formyltransferase/IMP cyclohydrolase
MYSTGGTQSFIEDLGGTVVPVEEITSYPSILDGRVKTLHPKVFGGILAIRNEDHIGQLKQFDIPTIDLVIVDLYPFEETVKSNASHDEIIEKIDIGGVSLIRAAAKNYNDVIIVSSKDQYRYVADILRNGNGSSLEQRKFLAKEAFKHTSHYDSLIFKYFAPDDDMQTFKVSHERGEVLRYGENPHQKGMFFGTLEDCFKKLSGKEISYNNLVDIDSGVQLMREFKDANPTFAILKHTNACGVATRDTVFEAWQDALAGDPISAFGGILITNTEIDLTTAQEIDKIFYEVLIAPGYSTEAIEVLKSKPKRILLELVQWPDNVWQYKSLLNGVIVQEMDQVITNSLDYQVVTEKQPTDAELLDLRFAEICVKHLKSNTIVLVKDSQLIGMGCGQTSRIEACKNAIDKAKTLGFNIQGAVMASDAFFPFPDCVELASEAGVKAVLQPGGSIKDQLSIDFCNKIGISMVMTGIRHFKH